MAKLPIIFTILCFSTLIANSKGLNKETKTIVKNPNPIRIYLIEVTTGPNATTYEVARSAISTTPTSFGIVSVGGSVIRAGIDPNSQLLGRTEGVFTTTGLFEPTLFVDTNFIFTAGKYKGSSLKLAGKRLIFESNQEIPITGGTGFFGGARGYSISNFVSFSPIGDTYTLEYNLYVIALGF